MGHKNKMEVQKAQLKEVFVKLLETNAEIMKFQATLTNVAKEKKGLLSLAKKSEKAIEIVRNVDHFEILISLYNMYINKKETYFISFYTAIRSKEMKKWDKTKKGFQEFQRLEQQAIDEYNKKVKESEKQTELIKKAQKEGKKVQMVYKDGKITPVIIEDKPN